MYLSNDNGKSWSPINNGLNGNINIRSIVTKDSNIFIATYGGGIYFSYNNGTSWRTLNEGLNKKNILTLAISDKYIYAGIEKGGVWKRSIKEIVGIVEPSAKSTLKIYPNPTNDYISIEIPNNNSTIEIINYNGQLVKRIMAKNQITEINISSFKSGIYLIKISDDKGVLTKKIIKL